MADQNFRESTAVPKDAVAIRLDFSYLRTVPGILKLTVMVLSIIGFLCIIVSEAHYTSRANWYNFVAMGGFWTTMVLLVFYLFHIIEKFPGIPWLPIEFCYCALWSFFYMTAAAACAALGKSTEAFAAAAFFGFCAMIIYAFDAYTKFLAWKRNEVAQGGHFVNMPVSPAY